MPAQGERAPSWKLKSVSGDDFRFPEATRGRPAVLMFWASWCPYCKALMPKLAEVQAEFAAQGLDVYAVNFAEKEGFTLDDEMSALPFRHFLRGDDVAEEYGVEMLPAFFIVSDGRIEYVRDYPDKTHPSQQPLSTGKKALMLAQWWKQRVVAVLTRLYADDIAQVQR